MKQTIRYRFLVIPTKLSAEIRITFDPSQSEYNSSYEGGTSTSISLFPFISITLTRPSEVDENGKFSRGQYNPNDTLTMTKFTLPIFIRELTAICNDMRIPEMYSYTGSRLDLNDTEAEKARRVFMIATTTLELVPVVIEQLDDTRVEGVKMKFNNEQSSVALTINELDALVYNLNHLDPDNLALQLYTSNTHKDTAKANVDKPKPYVDIAPKEFV